MMPFKLEAWSSNGALITFLDGRVALKLTFGEVIPEAFILGKEPVRRVANAEMYSKVAAASEPCEQLIVNLFLQAFDRERFLTECRHTTANLREVFQLWDLGYFL